MAEVRSKFGLDDYIAEQLSQYEFFLPLIKRVFDYATKEVSLFYSNPWVKNISEKMSQNMCRL